MTEFTSFLMEAPGITLSLWTDSAPAVQQAVLARQVVLLMDGAFSTMLVHRDPAYIEAAGAAAAALVANAAKPA